MGAGNSDRRACDRGTAASLWSQGQHHGPDALNPDPQRVPLFNHVLLDYKNKKRNYVKSIKYDRKQNDYDE
ncbi:hypothetical protein AA12467_1543 [Gluconobacter sphaericus NBRC 12467]|nr:hypothetical protein AA12467_1543 [Gluconobacter sphaericus NBRC 12467]